MILGRSINGPFKVGIINIASIHNEVRGELYRKMGQKGLDIPPLSVAPTFPQRLRNQIKNFVRKHEIIK